MQTRSYLLCRVINMGDSVNPDLKFTDVSSYGYMTESGRDDGTLTPDQKIDYASDKVELSYHKDGSPLYKCSIKGNYSPWRSNYMHPGFRQVPISECEDLLPIIVFQIRRPEIYKTKKIESTEAKKRVYVCSNEFLFTEKQPLFAVIYLRHKKVPLTLISTKDYYSDILAELTKNIDLCIFICRHTYPAPIPYYDNGLNCWITPYACNSISFCNQRALLDELTSKLNRNIFDRAFALFIGILSDGKVFHLTEEKLLILDEVDIFFEQIKNPIVQKPHFARFVLEIFGNNPQSFFKLSSEEKQQTLLSVWRIIISEGTQRNWF